MTPNQGEAQLFYAFPGACVRLTRNVDKDRGYVNGAVGVVRRVLSCTTDGIPTVFTVELSTGVLVVVHPIIDKKIRFRPCTYGYATTIRRAQGATDRHGSLWFDHVHPPERGYGYVGASRFKSKSGIYLHGQIRRTDWLPVRHSQKAMDQDQVERSEESDSDYDSEDEEAMYRPADGEAYSECDSILSESDLVSKLKGSDLEAYVKQQEEDYAFGEQAFGHRSGSGLYDFASQ